MQAFCLYVQDRFGVKSAGSFASEAEARQALQNAEKAGCVGDRIEVRSEYGTKLEKRIPLR